MKIRSAVLGVLIAIIAVIQCPAQAPQSGAPQSTENAPDVTYHLTLMLPQYRFIDTTGYGGRVGEYDTLQQSLGGDFSLNFVDTPRHLTIKSTIEAISRDDYESKSRLTVGKWFDFNLDSRSFVRHLDNNYFFGAGAISPDIVRIDSIPPEALLGIRRRMNNAQARIKLPSIPVKLFVKGGWQARDGSGQAQYYDMGGNGTLTDTGCDNCHSGSQYRTYNYTTRNIAGGAEVTLGPAKLVYQHEFRSFNDRIQSPVGIYGTSESFDGAENIPINPAGTYINNVLPRHQTQADSLQFTMAVAHHVTLNSDVSYARTVSQAPTVFSVPATQVFTSNPQNAFNADVTLTWNPVSSLREVADFHQQNLVNDWVQTFALSDPTILYPFGNPSLHRHWAGLKLAYRLSKQFDVETYYKRTNITRSNTSLWPQVSSPDNTDPLFFVGSGFSNMVPATFSNIAGMALHFHTGELWDARTGYEWTGTHAPGFVTDPQTNHRMFGDVTLTPVSWLTLGDDASIILQQSFAGFLPAEGVPQQRSNHLYTNTTFLTVKPVPQRSIGGGYTYLQDSLRTDMQFANDSAVGLYVQPLVPYKELSQSYSLHTEYEVKQRVRFRADLARTLAHSGFRPDLNPADYPVFPGAVTVAGYASEAAFATAFSQALDLSSVLVSQVDVPQSIVGVTADYHLHSGFDGGLRFNYGSYADRIGRLTVNGFTRPDLSGQLRSYTVFLGRVW
ncbi:MAG: hypothetical protein ACLQBK_01800 [Candidatus Sulfotelmatobacter sp.]